MAESIAEKAPVLEEKKKAAAQQTMTNLLSQPVFRAVLDPTAQERIINTAMQKKDTGEVRNSVWAQAFGILKEKNPKVAAETEEKWRINRDTLLDMRTQAYVFVVSTQNQIALAQQILTHPRASKEQKENAEKMIRCAKEYLAVAEKFKAACDRATNANFPEYNILLKEEQAASRKFDREAATYGQKACIDQVREDARKLGPNA